MGRRIKINSCEPRDLLALPGVGRKQTEKIVNLRKAIGNITPDLFVSLRIRNTQDLLPLLDFEEWINPLGTAVG